MEMTAHSLSHAKLPKPLIKFSSPPFLPLLQSKASFLASSSVPFQPSRAFVAQLQCVGIKARQQRNLGAIHASETESPPTDIAERWLLVPVGDGDTRHIGYNVKMPNAFEIASNEVTVGRLPEKADVVIPVATVSGLHARIQKKEGNLLVTDLDSTNGTFIDDKRLRPGAVATLSSGSCVTFGDTHLAMFRASKVKKVEAANEANESGDKPETDNPTETTATS
ncbi:Zeaxanthin epoxidase, chloroplastic [Morella rubra]|uniref:Zeaxanthin epoxidase, chloroplastic n=1 Tax=Morella rubra TaxID=262757 RepID=A0A6A1UQ44_9ROSI|nr:Zeaxanthin epoxidase, chloroplastic [Morella rubra]